MTDFFNLPDSLTGSGNADRAGGLDFYEHRGGMEDASDTYATRDNERIRLLP